MIQISSLSDKVKVQITTSIGYNFTLSYERSCEMDAVLLRNQLQEDLRKKIESIRKDAYELGWKEAKSKKVRKKDWFNGNINSSYV